MRSSVAAEAPQCPAGQTADTRPCLGLELLRVDDLIEPNSLLIKLRDGQDLLAQYLRSQFSPGTNSLLSECKGIGSPPESIQKLMADELNRLLQGPCLYDEARFAAVQLSEPTRSLLQQQPDGNARIRLNRLLLEQAFPGEIAFQPYVGPRPFAPEDRELFFGRQRETRDLRCLVVAHGVVLLYAQSGAGKTSLLNAGLVPMLTHEGFEVFPMARVRGLIPQSMEPDQIGNLYVFNSLASWAGNEAEPEHLASISIANFLANRQRLTDRDGHPTLRVLLFDQFEELFTSYPDRWRDREEFFQQVSEALEADRLLRVVFAMREEYLANLDRFAHLFVERLRTRFRLERMRGDAALRAIVGPLEGTGCSFAPAVADNLVQELLESRVEDATGKIVVAPGEFLEPVQLQVVCQNLWRELPPHTLVITEDHLRMFGDVDEALKSFYERAVQAAISKTGVPEGHLRNWFDRRLITTTGIRGVVFRGPESAEGIPNAAVDVLENDHLIRAELRAGARWYELTHDRFIGPIQKSNGVWKQKTEVNQISARLQEEAHQKVRRIKQSWMRYGFVAALALLSIAVVGWVRANKAANEAEREKKNAQGELRLRTVKDGMRLLETGDVAGSLLLFVEALRKDDAGQERLDRLRAVSGMRQLAQPFQLLPHERVSFAAFSPDGKLVVTAGADGNARLWDPRTGRELPNSPLQHDDDLNDAAFNDDSRYLVTASGERGMKRGKARVWGVADGAVRLLSTLPGNDAVIDGAVIHASLSPDGRHLVTVSEAKEGPVLVWDWASSPKPNPIELPIAKLDPNKDLRRQPMNEPLNPKVGQAKYATFSPDGRFLVVATATELRGGTVQLWRWNDGEPQQQWWDETSGVATYAAFSHDSRHVVATSGEQDDPSGEARVYDAEMDRPMPTPLMHRGGVIYAEFSPDDRYVVTTSHDFTARVWDFARRVPPLAILKHGSSVFRASFSPDGRNLVTASRDQTAQVWKTVTGELVVPPLNHRGTVSVAQFSPDDTQLVLTSSRDMARLWRLETGNPPLRVLGSGSWIDSALSPDGSCLVIARSEEHDYRRRPADTTGHIELWNLLTDAEPTRLTEGRPVRLTSFSPDGQLLLLAIDKPTGPNEIKHKPEDRLSDVRVWNTVQGVWVADFEVKGTVRYAALSDDHELVALVTEMAGQANPKVNVWDISQEKTEPKWSAPVEVQGPVNHVAFSPNGRYLAVATGGLLAQSGQALLWQSKTGETLWGPLKADGGGDKLQQRPPEKGQHNGGVLFMSFDPDSTLLVTASADDSARVWDIATGKVLSGKMNEKAEFVDKIKHTSDVTSATFSPDGRLVVTTSFGQVTGIWEPNGNKRGEVEHGTYARISPEGERLVTASRDGTVRLWDLKTTDRRDLASPAPDESAPDGRRAPPALITLFKQPGEVQYVSFSAAGDRVIMVSYGGDQRRPVSAESVSSPTGRSERFPNTPAMRPPSPPTMISRVVLVQSWDISEPSDSVKSLDLENYSKLVSARQINQDIAELTSLEPESLKHAWDRVAGGELLKQLGKVPALRQEEQAAEYEATDQWFAAAWHISRLIKENRSASLFGRLAQAHAKLGQWEKAVAEYTEAIGIDPNDWQLLVGRGHAYTNLGRWKDAIDDYSRAIQQEQDESSLRANRARAHAAIGQWNEAIDDLTDALRLGPLSLELFNERARAHIALRHWKEAVADYTDAIQLAPADFLKRTLLTERADAYVQSDDFSHAAADFAEVIKLQADDVAAWYPLALARLAGGDVKGYRTDCASMLRQFDGTGDPHTANEVAWTCALAVGSVDDLAPAIRLAERAVSGNPGNYNALNTLGAIYYRAGRFDDAIDYLNRARRAYSGEDSPAARTAQVPDQSNQASKIQIEDGTVWDWLFLAMAHHRKGQPVEASRWLDRAADWIDQREAERSEERRDTRPLSWKQRQELLLLRREAESVLSSPN